MLVRVVLVEPQEAGNVGATARAMKNFGFTDLWIVGGKRERTDNVSAWWALGAIDVVEGATRVDTLAEALADCHLTIATTAIRGRQVFDHLDPAAAVHEARERLSEEHRLAIVFGREKWGLSRAEVMLCQRTASIPTWPEFPTMNLAQSVAIFCYELARGPARSTTLRKREPVPHQLANHLHEKTRELLHRVHFFGDKSPDRVCAELQAITGRAVLSMREASLLLSMVRRIDGALKESAAQDEG